MRQVGFWVIAMQAAVALALGIPGEAVMGLVGATFVAGTAALGFLLTAEVVAATAAVSEAALIYVARKRNMAISLGMIVLQAGLSAGFILLFRRFGWPPNVAGDRAGGRADAVAGPGRDRQGAAAVAPARRAGLAVALAADLGGGGGGPGRPGAIRLPEWAELIFGIPAILLTFGAVLWWRGFSDEDRELFRMRKADIEELSLPDPSSGGDAPR